MFSQHAGIDDTIWDSPSVLLLAPSFESPDDEACIDLLTVNDPAETNVLSVTVSVTPEQRVALWRREVGSTLPKRATVIDARGVSKADTPAPNDQADVPASITVRSLSTDAQLLDLGMAIASELGAWESTSERTAVCLHSLSALVDTYTLDRIVTLVNALNGLTAWLGASGHHHLDPGAVSEEVVATLRPLYDVVVESFPDGEWVVTHDVDSEDTPSFRSSTPPPGTIHSSILPPDTIPMPYSFQTVLDLIATPRRRTLLYHLKDRNEETIPFEELVDSVYERERAIPARTASSSREALATRLATIDLPMLADSGVVAFDREEQLVHYHSNTALEAYLSYAELLELG